MQDLWADGALALLDRTPRGRLAPTPAWLGTIPTSAEFASVPESCEAELGVHRRSSEAPLAGDARMSRSKAGSRP